MMFNRQMTYTNELIQFYDERTNEAIGIITEYTPQDDMYRFYDVNRVHFYTGFNEDGSTTTNGFTGVVIQEIFDTNYTNLSYYNENTVIEGLYKTLAHNEMVISKDISMKKGVQVGDSAFIIIDHTTIELTVVAIIEPTGNITNVNTSLIEGLLIINAFTDMSSYDYKTLHFFNRETAVQSYSEEIIIIDDISQYLKSNRLGMVFNIIFIFTTFLIPIYILIYKVIRAMSDANYYVINPIKTVPIILANYMIVSIISMILTYLITNVLDIFNYSVYYVTSVLTLLVAVGFICYHLLIIRIWGIDI